MDLSVAQGIRDIEIAVTEFDMLANHLTSSSTELKRVEKEAVVAIIDAMREFIVGGFEWR